VRSLLIIASVAVGCQEYELNTKEDAEPPVTSPEPTLTTPTVVTTDTTPMVTADTGTPPPLGCEGIPVAWSWLARAPFPEEPDPVDALGVPFYEVGHDELGWSAVTLPDRSVPVYHDRVYRTSVELPHLPPGLTVSLQSDDGIWLWVNGVQVAHHGGDWQQEGCVNENANCLVTEVVPDIDLTPWLVEGPNVIAARVSNAIENAYFEVIPTCVE